MKIPRALGWFAVGWTGLFWLICVGIPVLQLFFRAQSGLNFLDPSVISVAKATAYQAGISVLFAGTLGMLLGLLMAQVTRARPKRILEALLLIPSSVPTVAAAIAWVAWLGRSGYLAHLGLRLDWAYSLKAVILAHVFFNAPWIALQVSRARQGVPRVLEEASATLGASSLSRFRWVVWPQIRWAFATALVQVFALCSMSFALVLILGGGPPVETLETSLYSKIRYGSLDLAGAIACALWELILTLTPWILVLWMRSRDRGVLSVGESKASQSTARSWSVTLICMSIAAFFLIPYGSVSVGEGQSLSIFFSDEIREPLVISLKLALTTGLITLCTGILAVLATSFVPPSRSTLRSFVSALLALPSGLSVLVLGLGVWLSYSRWIDPFEGSFGAIIALQVTSFFPLAFRMLWPVAQSGQLRLLEAASTLGASPWQAFRIIEWPRWKGPVFSVLALVTGGALGEVAAVSLFYSEKLIPLPLLVSRWMAQYRFAEARSISSLLLLGAALATVLVSLWGVPGQKDFERVQHAK